ncbi:MAG: hypothetical protein Q8L84_00205, partial [Hyphomonas sp.]|nr:hypothetical protein [Hyphomonas sp.]
SKRTPAEFVSTMSINSFCESDSVPGKKKKQYYCIERLKIIYLKQYFLPHYYCYKVNFILQNQKTIA